MKKIALIATVFGLVGVMAVAAWAAPKGQGWGGPGRGAYTQLTPEQAAELDKARTAFLEDTLKLRQDMSAKAMELRTITSKPDFDKAKATALANELVDLRAQIAKKRIEHFSKIEGWQGAGMGRGFGGPGYGCPGGGNGPRGGYGRGGGACFGGGYGPGAGVDCPGGGYGPRGGCFR